MSSSESERPAFPFSRASSAFFGGADVLSSLLILVGVFRGLPSRYAPIDGAALVLALALAVAGVGLILRKPWGPRVARTASIAVLVVGLALVAALVITASYLSGIYGPVGKGGALVLFLVAALALPYLVVLPVAQLAWLGPRKSARQAS